VSRVRSFCAGPCTMPAEVLEEVQSELSDFEGGGMSLIDMSHRSAAYEALHAMPDEGMDEGMDELAGLMRDFARSPG
jgi:phosphoserine aminotransferase